MDKLYVVDTNVILDSPEIITEYKVVLLSHVLRELDKHKISRNNDLSYKARRATRYIKENKNNIHFDVNDYDSSEINLDNSYQDNNILFSCIKNDYALITNDLLLQLKAESFNIEVVDDNTNTGDSINYSGIKKIYLSSSNDQQEIANIYSNSDIEKYKLLTNQYLIVYDKDNNNEVIDKLRFDGENLIPLKLPFKKTVKPKNEEQACAIDLLNNNNIPIKIIAGTYGSGKTYLTVKVALHKVLEEGQHSKIMMIRNPIGSGEAIGFLTGDKDNKTKDFFKPIVQHLEGGEQEAYYLEQRGQLIKEIPYYIKGLSIEDTFVIVDEAEDLDVKLLKLVGTRLADKSAIVFSGDFKQAEGKYMHNNGLQQAIDKLKGNPLVGIVVMEEDVRSEASKVFAEL